LAAPSSTTEFVVGLEVTRRCNFRCRHCFVDAGSHTVYITADGNVYPCTALMAPAYRLGNLRRTPLEVLLARGRTSRIHDQRARLKPRGTCAGCSTWDACHGGCPGWTLAADGSLTHGTLEGAMPACLLRLHRG
jgi:radical SAM protein with 4Fe4S-binding SPASM domain